MSEIVEVLHRLGHLTHPPIRVRCACGRVYRSVQPAKSAIARRKCRVCVRIEGWDAEAAKQTVCAGHESVCQTSAEPPAKAFRKSVIRMRRGQPWRCMSCARHMVLSKQGQAA